MTVSAHLNTVRNFVASQEESGAISKSATLAALDEIEAALDEVEAAIEALAAKDSENAMLRADLAGCRELAAQRNETR